MLSEQELRKRMESAGQSHVFQYWEALSSAEREILLCQLSSIDLNLIQSLHQKGESESKLPPLEDLHIPDGTEPGEREKEIGQSMLKNGEVAVILVAGGQGSRLEFPHAKGMFPIGPVSGHTLFQIHIEKIRALGQRYGKTPLLLIMTSEATDAEVRQFFEENQNFGLATDDVVFFCQKSLAAMSMDGKLLMEKKNRVFTSPNGHGGVLQALHDHQIMELLESRGVKDIFYYQVDNPLVRVAEPAFLGAHRDAESDVSIKVVRKKQWNEPIGNFVLNKGRCDMIEYTELPDEWKKMENDDGRLKFWAGSIAIHIFSFSFLNEMVRNYDSLPYHIAKKKVAHLDDPDPGEKNALKFERFIFDVLPKAERFTLVETSHEEEFEPLKNKDGDNSPETVKSAMSNLARGWLTQAGVEVAEDVNVEISPLFALDKEELTSKVDSSTRVESHRFFK